MNVTLGIFINSVCVAAVERLLPRPQLSFPQPSVDNLSSHGVTSDHLRGPDSLRPVSTE